MYAHERSLMERMKNRPFTIVGVNSDSGTKGQDAVKKNNLNWPSFVDSARGRRNISDVWAVEGWPTLYLIDHKGVIREKWVGSPGDKVLDAKVEQYVKQAEGQ